MGLAMGMNRGVSLSLSIVSIFNSNSNSNNDGNSQPNLCALPTDLLTSFRLIPPQQQQQPDNTHKIWIAKRVLDFGFQFRFQFHVHYFICKF